MTSYVRPSEAKAPDERTRLNGVAKKPVKTTIKKEELRPRERAPILPTKKFEDKRTRDDRRPKHKKDPRVQGDET